MVFDMVTQVSTETLQLPSRSMKNKIWDSSVIPKSLPNHSRIL